MYAMNVALLGVTLFIVFGITHENIKGGVMLFRSVAGIVMLRSSQEASNDSRYREDDDDVENGLREALKGKVNEGRKGKRADRETNHSAPLAQELSGGLSDRKGVVKTHLGTKIGVNLGGIKAPIEDCASAYNKYAVSGTSMPPKNHPMSAHLEVQREKYTKEVLSFVLQR
jgi:hypothetical protein